MYAHIWHHKHIIILRSYIALYNPRFDYIMWEQNDQQNYAIHVHHHLGQICNDEFSQDIRRYASDPANKTFLEIGTWNGLGSTRAFNEGFSLRERPTNEGFSERPTNEGFSLRERPTIEGKTPDYVFYSLECNTDKSNDAAKLYASNPNIHILNEVIWNQEPEDFYEVFPQCKSNPTFKHWHEVDMINMQKCPVFLDRTDLPEIFDVILLDGGEFTTYYEFQLLKNRCKILMLDDTNVDKCTKIVQELQSDSTWRIIKQVNVRNGYLIAERNAI